MRIGGILKAPACWPFQERQRCAAPHRLRSLRWQPPAPFAATPAFAQATGDTDTQPPTPPVPSAEPSEGVADIVVTATRRSENLQDIPLSVATVDDETLAAINSGGADIRGLSAGSQPQHRKLVRPHLPRFYIRGLGNTDFDLNASQPVSLVYDDVVLENPILKGFPAFDVDRIEVLRGPQGTCSAATRRPASSSSTR